MNTAGLIGDMLSQTIRFTRVSERLGFSVESLTASASQIGKLHEIDPELGPELRVALDHLVEAGEALSRAIDFNNARLDAFIDNARKEQT